PSSAGAGTRLPCPARSSVLSYAPQTDSSATGADRPSPARYSTDETSAFLPARGRPLSLRRRSGIRPPASPAHTGILRGSSRQRLQSAAFHAPDSWRAELPPPPASACSAREHRTFE